MSSCFSEKTSTQSSRADEGDNGIHMHATELLQNSAKRDALVQCKEEFEPGTTPAMHHGRALIMAQAQQFNRGFQHGMAHC
jgi:hypothetical protein